MPNDAQDIPQPTLALPRSQSGCAPHPDRNDTDIVALGIALTAIILLISIGSVVVPATVAFLSGQGPRPDHLLTVAFLLNTALVLLGWQRYRKLTEEIAAGRRAEERARLMAETDPLTGLLNRRSLGPAADRLFADASAQGLAVAFVMLDLDNFKQVNDGNGHAAGDALLIQAAHRIGSVLPEGALLARIGGDEFACVLSYAPDRPRAVDALVDRLIDTVCQPVRFSGTEIEATISAGIASHLPGASNDPRAVLHQADIAMYHAKKRGRNRHCWFDPAMEQELRLRSEVETGIRCGLASGEFAPCYQKEIDLRTGRLTGYEMLPRWQRVGEAEISPELFIPIAEETGLIDSLFENLLRQALNDARDWPVGVNLAVNVSPHHLRNPWFAQKLLKLLVEANYPPHRLEIELSESALSENISLIRTIMTSLQNQGVRITFDNFGTGQSSLSRLRLLPFDRLKIGRDLIASMERSEESAAIVRSVVSLGEGLGLPITVEGVESPAVLAELCRLGNYRGQGMLYGAPQTAAELLDELQAKDMVKAAEASLGTAHAAPLAARTA